MGILEAGNRQAAVQVEERRAGPQPRLDVLTASDRHDLSTGNDHPARIGRRRGHGGDGPSTHHQVGNTVG